MQHCFLLSRKSVAVPGVRDGHRNRKNRKNRCDFGALRRGTRRGEKRGRKEAGQKIVADWRSVEGRGSGAGATIELSVQQTLRNWFFKIDFAQ